MDFWLKVLLLFAAGTASGFINVMAGGGSLINMPVMRFLGMEGPLVNGTNRVAMIVQDFVATVGFWRKGYSEFRLSFKLSLCALPGAVLGAWLGNSLRGVWFDRVLALVMIGVMVVMTRKEKGKEDGVEVVSTPQRRRWGYVLMVAAGFYGGFIQAGVGLIMMAILHRVMGMDLVRVNMHKVIIVGVYTIPVLAIFAMRGNVDWLTGILLSVGNAVGGFIGSNVTIDRGEKAIRVVFNLALIAMAIKLLLG